MRQRGIVIPTALFFVMVAFLAATIVSARTNQDLAISQHEERQISLELAARGASAKALTLLNEDDGWKEHDIDNPANFGGDPFETEAWVVKDSENPNVYHVFGKAYLKGSPEKGELSSRVVIRRPDVEGTVVTVAPHGDNDPNVPDSMFYKRRYDKTWELLPFVPVMEYSDTMELTKNLDKPGGFVTNLASDENGRLFAMYLPGFDRMAAVRNTIQRHLNSGNYHKLWNSPSTRVDELGNNITDKVFGNAVLMSYDQSTKTWDALPAVPNVDFSSGQGVIQTDQLYKGAIGGIEVSQNKLYVPQHKDGQDALLSLDLSDLDHPQWELIPPPPHYTINENGAQASGSGTMKSSNLTEIDSEGNLYSIWLADDPNYSGVFRRKAGASDWELIEMPEQGKFDSDGNFQKTGKPVNHLRHIDVTPEGKVYGVWNPGELPGPQKNDPYVIYEFDKDENGVESWKPLPAAPRYQFNDAGEAELDNQGGLNLKAKAISVDSEGRVITSFQGKGDVDDGIVYSSKDSAEPLAPLPFKVYNAEGDYEENENQAMEALQVEGGGAINGQKDRYIPIYRY